MNSNPTVDTQITSSQLRENHYGEIERICNFMMGNANNLISAAQEFRSHSSGTINHMRDVAQQEQALQMATMTTSTSYNSVVQDLINSGKEGQSQTDLTVILTERLKASEKINLTNTGAIDSLEEEKEMLTDQLSQMKQELVFVKAENERLRQGDLTMKSQLQSLEKDLVNQTKLMQTQDASHESEIEELREEKRVLKNRLDVMLNLVQTKNETIEEAQLQVKQLQDAMKKQQEEFQERTDLEMARSEEVADLKAREHSILEENADLKRRLTGDNKTLKDTVNEYNRVKEVLQRLTPTFKSIAINDENDGEPMEKKPRLDEYELEEKKSCLKDNELEEKKSCKDANKPEEKKSPAC